MKLNYCTEFLWKKIFLFNKNKIFKMTKKIIFNRSSKISPIFIGYKIKIYNGKKWKNILITKWNVGFKYGEFTWNKKRALYKAKQLKKKI